MIATDVSDIYLDSNFLLNLYLNEVESPIVDAALQSMQGSAFVTKLTDVEVISTLHRRLSVEDGRLAVQTYLSNRMGGLFHELEIDGRVFDLAQRIAQQHAKVYKLKSLDILHLATASRHRNLMMATYDKNMRAAASALGLAVLPA